MSVWRRQDLFVCELCRRQTELYYAESSDQYLCEDCLLDPKTETGETDENNPD